MNKKYLTTEQLLLYPNQWICDLYILAAQNYQPHTLYILVVASGNRVVTLYTQNCTDHFNKTHKKRIMAITEINDLQKVSKVWVVTHEE